ncbi:MAG: hypothetical protein HON90_12115, partial [Halobacteriovoraceae bacterium]|nr:hypothetical protein [Halobacteriovoraceae bacterium]
GFKVKLQKASKANGKPRCPGFPLLNPKDKDINYYAKDVRISAINNRNLFQCNWRRYHTEESRKKHKIGYKKAKLHLPIFRSGDAIIYKRWIIIPYDITLMSQQLKKSLAIKAGAHPDQINVKNAFREIPLNLRTHNDSSSSDYNIEDLSDNFALINKNIYAGASTETVNICQGNETEHQAKSCISLDSIQNVDFENSSFVKSKLNNKHKLPIIKLHFAPKANLEEIKNTLNSSPEKLQIFQKVRSQKNEKSFISFSLIKSSNLKRVPFKKQKIQIETSIDLAKKILSFSHKDNIKQALSYVSTLIKQKKITKEELREDLSSVVQHAIQIADKNQASNDKLVAVSMEVLRFAYQGEEHPLGYIGELYSFAAKYHYNSHTSLVAARKISELAPINVKLMKDKIEGPIKGYIHSKQLRFSILNHLYQDKNYTNEDDIIRTINVSEAFIQKLNVGYESERLSYNQIMQFIHKLVFTHAPNDKQFTLVTQLINILQSYNPYSGNFEGQRNQVNKEFHTKVFHQVTHLVFDKKIIDSQVNLYKRALSFLYEIEGVYLYSLDDTLKKVDYYIFSEKLTISKLYEMQNNYRFWTSREETFISDRNYALELAEGPYIGKKQKSYKNLRPYYNAIKGHRKEISLDDKVYALKYAILKTVKRYSTNESIRLETQILNWLSSNFHSFLNVKKRKEKLELYSSEIGFSKEWFKRLHKKYSYYRKKGLTPRKAFKKTERIILSVLN